MRSISISAGAVLLAVAVIGDVSTAPSAQASTPAINGTYRATSVGEWAKTNETFKDEPTVVSTWTITSTCSNAQDCTGQVTSDQGWSAPLYTHDGGFWYVKRDRPNWEQCEDGTAATGKQTYYFYPAAPDGTALNGSPTLAGKDKTVGPSGACHINRWFVVEMPFRLDKLA